MQWLECCCREDGVEMTRKQKGFVGVLKCIWSATKRTCSWFCVPISSLVFFLKYNWYVSPVLCACRGWVKCILSSHSSGRSVPQAVGKPAVAEPWASAPCAYPGSPTVSWETACKGCRASAGRLREGTPLAKLCLNLCFVFSCAVSLSFCIVRFKFPGYLTVLILVWFNAAGRHYPTEQCCF